MRILDHKTFKTVLQLDGELYEEFNDIAACVAACSNYLSGTCYTARALKHIVIEKSTRETITQYSQFLNSKGLRLYYYSYPDWREYLSTIDFALGEGNPVIITEPSPYDPTGLWPHYCVICGKNDKGDYMIMDPYTDVKLERSPDTIRTRIVGGIFIVSR